MSPGMKSAGKRQSRTCSRGHSLRCDVIFISSLLSCVRSNFFWELRCGGQCSQGNRLSPRRLKKSGRRSEQPTRLALHISPVMQNGADELTFAQLHVACGLSAGSTTVYSFPASELQNRFRNEPSLMNFSLLHELSPHRTL